MKKNARKAARLIKQAARLTDKAIAKLDRVRRYGFKQQGDDVELFQEIEGYIAPISNSLDSASMDLGNEAVSLSLGSSIERRFPPDERLGETAIQDQLDLEEYFR